MPFQLQKWMATAACTGAFLLIDKKDEQSRGLLLVLSVVCGIRALSDKEHDKKGYPLAIVQYTTMIIALTMLGLIYRLIVLTR